MTNAAQEAEARMHGAFDSLDTLDHVALLVKDVAAAVAWYTRTFRCRVIYQDGTWAMLAFRNARLALMAPGRHPPHVAIPREDAARFGPLEAHRDGIRSIYLTDGDGNSIEVLDASSLSPVRGSGG